MKPHTARYLCDCPTCVRCGTRDSSPGCAACRPDLRDWPDLSEAAREEFRQTARIAAGVYEPAIALERHAYLAALRCAEFADAADTLLRCVLADALESGGAVLRDAGARQQFVERALTIPATPGVEALRAVVAAARAAVRPATPAELVREDGSAIRELREALAALDEVAGRHDKEPRP